MSIKKSLRILLILSSIIPIILLSLIAHGMLTERLVQLNTQNIQRTAQYSKNGLETILQTQSIEVSSLALQENLIEAVGLEKNGMPIPHDSLNTLLSKRCLGQDCCERISVYNLQNKVIASSDSSLIGAAAASDTTLNHISTTKSTALAIDGIHSMTRDNQLIYTMEIGAPILDSDTGSLLGYIVSTVNTSCFKKYLSSIAPGNTGYSILLNHEGIILYHPDPNYIGRNLNSEKLTSLVDNYKKGLMMSTGSFEYDFEDSHRLFGYSILPEQGLVLLVTQSLSEVKSITTFMLILLLILCGILLIVTFIIATFLAKKFCAPIISLRDTMRIASDGNLTVQSNIKQNNEIGELSKNFNKMLHIIKTNYEELEAMHERLLSREEQLRSNYDHIEYLAYHDTLTNLPNKLAFLTYVNSALASSCLKTKLHAIFFVDLDNFKTVNDTLGHEYGDTLLVKTAKILSSLLEKKGTLARAGGDEFLIFMEDIPSKECAVDFASKIVESFCHPLDLDGEIVYISLSIGISIYPDHGTSSKELIKNSDIAMYRSKDTGKNKYTLFDTSMMEELNRNTLILEILRNAVDSREAYINYQPLIDIETNEVVGYEALMRIRSERLGLLSPSEFIPIAEESGLITELSNWLLKEACTFNKRIIDLGVKPRPISVNISSVQISKPGFITMLSEILNETQLPPQYLELEITESTLVSSIMDATMLLNNLQELGVRLSLDDFGTGYSSLNYLTNMPIDTLKIDKSFIDNICSSKKDVQIAEAIIQLAHSLDIRVVAEGVESLDQLSLLKSKHCDVVQGYVFSKPLSPDKLLDLLQQDDMESQYAIS
jgi:diguanylate cyclase (GGDEF)-like protein